MSRFLRLTLPNAVQYRSTSFFHLVTRLLKVKTSESGFKQNLAGDGRQSAWQSAFGCACDDILYLISYTFTGGGEESSLYARLGAALTTSAIGISVANPSDVVKIRQQACNISDLARKWLLSCTQPAFSCKSIPCAGVTLRSASILSF